MSRRAIVLLALLSVAACSDVAPESGPGTVTATIVSPNGSEGAAAVTLVGRGIGDVEAVGDTEVHQYRDANGTRLVLVNQAGGTLSFQVALSDTTHLPVVVVQEVAAPDDELRASLQGYDVRFDR